MMTFKPRFRPSRRAFLSSTGALAVGITFLPRHSLSQEEKRLNFYNWDTYIGETTLEDFQGETGIEVKMDLFADNDELFAKLRAGNPGYDVIVPTNDYVERMIEAKMLIPLDRVLDVGFAYFCPAVSAQHVTMIGSIAPGNRPALPGTPARLSVNAPRTRTLAPRTRICCL